MPDDPTVCGCGCHRGRLMHFAPCCYRCSACGQGVKVGMHPQHLESYPGLATPPTDHEGTR